MKINIFGTAGHCTYCDGEVAAPKHLCDGYTANGECNEFVQWMHDEKLKSKLIDGYMHFKMFNGKLHTFTTYRIKDGENLDAEEVKKLISYTKGQWGDGIGEGFEQFEIENAEGDLVYLSPWHDGQKVEYEFIKS